MPCREPKYIADKEWEADDEDAYKEHADQGRKQKKF